MSKKIFLKLVMITITDTKTIIVFADILLDTFAAIGAAKALPITKPKTASQCLPPNIRKKVKELSVAIKNLQIFTVPNENKGCLPPAIKLDKTIEPQPPPKAASIKPPTKPNGAMFFIF